MMELALCIENDRHRKMETHAVSMLRSFYETGDSSLKISLMKAKNRPDKQQGGHVVADTQIATGWLRFLRD